MTIAPKEHRVSPPGGQRHAVFLNRLTEELGLFETKQKALMFAAALGAHEGKRKELSSRGEGIRLSIFEKAVDDTFIDALAVAETGDLHVLHPKRTAERIAIFEECACAGLMKMEEVEARPAPLAEELIRLVQLARQTRSEEISGLDPSALHALEDF